MNARPAKICDRFDEQACEILIAAQLRPGVTVADACNVIAVAIRGAHAKGYAEAMTWADMNLRPGRYAQGHTWLSPREERERLTACRAVRDSMFTETQADHDVERTEGWAAGEGAL